jgi:hypothetical protein
MLFHIFFCRGSAGSATKKQRLQTAESSSPPPPTPNSDSSTAGNDEVPSKSPLDCDVFDEFDVDNLPVKFEDEQITSFTQTIVETETEIDVTTSLDNNVEEMQHEVATEIPFETVDAIISLVPMGGANLRVLAEQLVTQSENTSEQVSAFLEGDELQTLCSELSDSDDQVVINAVDALTSFLSTAEATGLLGRAVEVMRSQDVPSVLEMLVQHDNLEVSGRAERLRDAYFMSNEELQRLDEVGLMTVLTFLNVLISCL